MFNFLLVLQYLPSVLSVVMAVENTFASEPGATKKQIIMDSLTNSVKALDGKVDPKILAGISTLIDTAVGVLNVVGIFTKKTPVAVGVNPTPVAPPTIPPTA